MASIVFQEYDCEAKINVPGRPFITATVATRIRVSVCGSMGGGVEEATRLLLERVSAVMPDGGYLVSISVVDCSNATPNWEDYNGEPFYMKAKPPAPQIVPTDEPISNVTDSAGPPLYGNPRH
jgi:hypothetical protein